MKNATNTPHRIDDYLQRIEERERSSRRKKMILGVLGIISVLGAGSLYVFLNLNKELRKYSIQELSKEIVTEIFDDDDSRIVVAHALGTDTIQNINEYQSLVDLFEGSDIQPAFYQGGESSDGFENSSDNPSEEILQKFSIDISGNRIEGNQLVFTIEDFDPDVEYTLSFGTGYKRKVGRVSRYTYNGFGTYRLRLLANSEDRGSSIYTKSIKIDRKRRENTNREVLAEGPAIENIPESTPAEPEITDGATRDIRDESVEDTENTTEDTSEEQVSAIQAAPKEEETEDDIPEMEAEKLRDTITESKEPVAIDDPVEAPAEKKIENAVLFNADIMPEFPGGTSGLKRYVRKNYAYPAAAREAGIEGTVFVRFVVQSDGTITNIGVVKGLGYGCDDEAVRLIRKMPKWIPGEHDGKRVSVYKTMPIGFKLFNY